VLRLVLTVASSVAAGHGGTRCGRRSDRPGGGCPAVRRLPGGRPTFRSTGRVRRRPWHGGAAPRPHSARPGGSWATGVASVADARREPVGSVIVASMSSEWAARRRGTPRVCTRSSRPCPPPRAAERMHPARQRPGRRGRSPGPGRPRSRRRSHRRRPRGPSLHRRFRRRSRRVRGPSRFHRSRSPIRRRRCRRRRTRSRSIPRCARDGEPVGGGRPSGRVRSGAARSRPISPHPPWPRAASCRSGTEVPSDTAAPPP
jgi:hypothetical protein